MPGRVFLTSPMSDLAAALGVSSDPVSDEPSRRNIAPGQDVVVMTETGLKRMRWGMIPVGRVNARGRPVMETIVNARSETLFDKSAYAGTGRAVFPVNGWYEWTGEKRKKTAWRITPKKGGFLWFAAIADTWMAPGGKELLQMASVTCPPSGDVRDIHHRMAVILRQQDIRRWLTGAASEVADLMVPWPDGSLKIEEASDVDWGAK